MKRKLLIICFIIASFSLYAQSYISLSYQPVDLGIGLRFDRIFERVGFYVSQSKGNYKFDNCFVNDHYKTSAGGMFKISNGFVSAGLSYNKYGEYKGYIIKNALKPISFDIGAGVRMQKLIFAIRFDPLKGESSIDFGIRL